MRTLSFEELCLAIRACGVEAGDLLLVHSALGAIGPIEGGAQTLIEAFLAVLGEEGTLAMPAMTDPFVRFDPATSPSNVGALTEALRKDPRAHRSRFPVHSVVARGRRAEALCAEHERCSAGCGAGSPFYKMWQWGGKILLLGVDQDRNTCLHAFEDEAASPYFWTLEIPAPNYAPYHGEGTFTLRDFPEGHRNFIALSARLRAAGLLRYGKIGAAVTQLMEARRLHDFLLPLLREDPFLFLCENPNCRFCAAARAGLPVQ